MYQWSLVIISNQNQWNETDKTQNGYIYKVLHQRVRVMRICVHKLGHNWSLGSHHWLFAWLLFGVKPLSQPTVTHCWLDSSENVLATFNEITTNSNRKMNPKMSSSKRLPLCRNLNESKDHTLHFITTTHATHQPSTSRAMRFVSPALTHAKRWRCIGHMLRT